ncbi:hypothetical protein PABG_01742 [Paracoccidioides brasiliensis Pb03]|nr:hypothetical protein PABG_01742 [Paracoccidioides brasiliensis Pb03]
MLVTSFAATSCLQPALTSLTTAASKRERELWTGEQRTEDRDPSSVDFLSSAASPRSEWEDSPTVDQILGAAHRAQLLADAHSTRCPGGGPRVDEEFQGWMPAQRRRKEGRTPKPKEQRKAALRPKWNSMRVTGSDQAAHQNLAAGTGRYRYLLAGLPSSTA